MNAVEVEIALSWYFDKRRNIIVPNVSWGLHIHEVDMLVIYPSGWATEVEIKVSIRDLKNDFKKDHTHNSNKIQKLYFAVPDDIKAQALSLIPPNAGLLSIKGLYKGGVEVVKTPAVNKSARRLTDNEIMKVLHLGCMRIFTLKERLYYYKSGRWNRVPN